MRPWGKPFETGPQGPAGSDGTNGDKGWSPVFAIATDGDRRVLQLVDWVAGEGAAPTEEGYVTASGLDEDTIGNGVDIRGTPSKESVYLLSENGGDPTGGDYSTTAINALIASATNYGTRHATIVCDQPEGMSSATYIFDSAIILYSKTKLVCSGVAMDFLAMADFSNAMYGVQSGYSDTIFNTDIIIDGGEWTAPDAGTILPTSQMKHFTCKNMVIKSGGLCYFYNRNERVTLEDCTILNEEEDGFVMGITEKAKHFVINRVAIQGDAGMYISSGASTGECEDILIVQPKGHNLITAYFINAYDVHGLNLIGGKLSNDSPANGSILSADALCKNIEIRGMEMVNVNYPINYSAVACGNELRAQYAYQSLGKGDSVSGSNRVTFAREKITGGTALAGSDVTISSGWGNTATKSIAGTDAGGVVTVASAGAGQAVNATITLTNKDGTWNSKAIPHATLQSGPTAPVACMASMSGNNLLITYSGLPVAGTSYKFSYSIKEGL